MPGTVVLNSIVVALKTLTLVLGGAITYYAMKAAHRTGQRPLQLLGVGFGLVTVGALVAGITDQLLQLGRSTALVIESSFTTIGFLVILYSLVLETDLEPHSDFS